MTIRDVKALVAAGLADDSSAMREAATRFAIAITPDLVRLIDRPDPHDPIARQFVPSAHELSVLPREIADPIGDDAHSPVPGIVHRYANRVLLKVISVCPVYCRFCFRREMIGPASEAPLTGGALEAALAYIGAHDEISEVIMTGGDPFMLSERRAREITERLEALAHIKVLRWHTRVPVAEPARVSPDFVKAITPQRGAGWVAIHANHPRELTDEARAAFARMRQAGLTLVSQSVLLKGVNDDVETLAALMDGFVQAGVKPYYLHHADLAPGTSHFRTTIAEGQALMRQLHARLSGLAMPHYVLDIPGGDSKVPLTPETVRQTGDGIQVQNARGAWVDYRG